MLPKLVLKQGEGRRVERGHLWVFSNEVASLDDLPPEQDEVAVFSSKGRFLGSALLSPSSLIRARIYSRQPESCDSAFIRSRLDAALALRRTLLPDRNAFRLCHSESDFLPGLVLDVFGSCVVVQIFTRAMEHRKSAIIRAIQDVLSPAGIYERSDVPMRELEGLPPVTGLLAGEVPSPLEIKEQGVILFADPHKGQKTGFFLDMAENRRALAHLFRGRTVLDAYCHVGAWSLIAAANGARETLALDSSADAIALAELAMRRNGMTGRCRFERADASESFRRLHEQGRHFDFIIVDPPPLARRKKDVPNALRAYRDINLRAMRLLAPGGIYATASCSHNITREDFLDALRMAARDARTDLDLFFSGAHAPDHPVHLGTPETDYLKFFAFIRI